MTAPDGTPADGPPRWSPAPRIAWDAEETGRVAVLALDGGAPFVLSGSGGAIWCALWEAGTRRPVTARELAELLGPERGVPPQDLTGPLEEFLSALERQGLVRRHSTGGRPG